MLSLDPISITDPISFLIKDLVEFCLDLIDYWGRKTFNQWKYVAGLQKSIVEHPLAKKATGEW